MFGKQFVYIFFSTNYCIKIIQLDITGKGQYFLVILEIFIIPRHWEIHKHKSIIITIRRYRQVVKFPVCIIEQHIAMRDTVLHLR